MTDISITLIIPSFNRPAGTERALASALAQLPQDAEALIIDDGSRPSLTFAAPLDPRARVIRSETNRGAAAARNLGLREARGDWAAFLDSDDVWLPNTFAPRWAAAREQASAGGHDLTIWAAGFRYVDERGRGEVRIPITSREPAHFASGCWFCPGSTALFRRAPILTAIGDQDELLRRLEDVDWFLRLACVGGGVSIHPSIAAEIARGPKQSLETLSHATAHLKIKHTALSSSMRRRLDAYLALERASAEWSKAQYAQALTDLAISWALKPRLQLALENFWPSSLL